MKPAVRESLKKGIVFALIGAAIALAAPPLLTFAVAATGLTAGGLFGASTTVTVLGSALVFGGIGVLKPYLQSLFSAIFRKDAPEMTSKTVTGKGSDFKRENVSAQQSPDHALQAVAGQRADATFCQKIDADRSRGKAPSGLGV